MSYDLSRQSVSFLLNSLFTKYSIYKKREFTSLFAYILNLLIGGMIQFENDYEYCVKFYTVFLKSVVFDASLVTTSMFTLFEKELADLGANYTFSSALPQPLPSGSADDVGRAIDACVDLLVKSSIQMSDFTDNNNFNVIQVSPTSYTINGIQASTLRGCLWKLLYSNLNYYQSN